MRADTGRDGGSDWQVSAIQLDWGARFMPSEETIYVAIELSFSSWLVAARLPGAQKTRLHRVEGGNTAELLALIGELRSNTSRRLGRAADLACCFEAGRDGFWLQRLLSACAVQRRRFPVGASPTRRFAPAGSNRSSHGGNEMAEAFE